MEAGELLLMPERRAKTVGGNKNFAVARVVRAVRELEITPHVAQKDTA